MPRLKTGEGPNVVTRAALVRARLPLLVPGVLTREKKPCMAEICPPGMLPMPFTVNWYWPRYWLVAWNTYTAPSRLVRVMPVLAAVKAMGEG